MGFSSGSEKAACAFIVLIRINCSYVNDLAIFFWICDKFLREMEEVETAITKVGLHRNLAKMSERALRA